MIYSTTKSKRIRKSIVRLKDYLLEAQPNPMISITTKWLVMLKTVELAEKVVQYNKYYD